MNRQKQQIQQSSQILPLFVEEVLSLVPELSSEWVLILYHFRQIIRIIERSNDGVDTTSIRAQLVKLGSKSSI
jgi:hypothetical protein